MRRAMLALMMGFASSGVYADQGEVTPECKLSGPVATMPQLPEASGLAASRRTPGRLWVHNDSGDPVLFAVDANGKVSSTVQLIGARVEDWEALAAGPCAAGSCLYLADIGDNEAARRRITVYRIPEPDAGDQSADAKDAFHATYPDGAHDAEALLVMPDGTLLIVTKGGTGPVALYRFPRQLRPGETHALERVATRREGDSREANAPITDGTVSADGRWVVLRTRASASIHRAADLLKGDWRAAQQIDLKGLEQQGEGVAIAADGSIFLASEGGGSNRPGTLARLACTGLAFR